MNVTQLELGESLLSSGSAQRALLLFRSVAKQAQDPLLRSEAFLGAARASQALGNLRRALVSFKRAQDGFRRLPYLPGLLATQLESSACLRVLGRFSDACRAWASFSTVIGFHPSLGRLFGLKKNSTQRKPPPLVLQEIPEILLEVGLVSRGQEQWSEAQDLCAEAFALFKKRGDQDGMVRAQWAWAGVERFLGHFKRAEILFGQTASLAHRQGDKRGQAYALCGRAACRRILGYGAASLADYRRAYAIFLKTKDVFGRAYGLCGMANAHRVWLDPEPTFALYRRAARLYGRVGDEGSLAFCWWGLGGSFRRCGQWAQAKVHYLKALKNFQKVRDHRGEILCLLGLARVHEAQSERGKISGAQATMLRRKAAHIARAAHLPWEMSLVRWESDRENPIAGVPPSASKGWKDLP